MTHDEKQKAIEAAAREVLCVDEKGNVGVWLDPERFKKLHAALEAEVAPEPPLSERDALRTEVFVLMARDLAKWQTLARRLYKALAYAETMLISDPPDEWETSTRALLQEVLTAKREAGIE